MIFSQSWFLDLKNWKLGGSIITVLICRASFSNLSLLLSSALFQNFGFWTPKWPIQSSHHTVTILFGLFVFYWSILTPAKGFWPLETPRMALNTLNRLPSVFNLTYCMSYIHSKNVPRRPQFRQGFLFVSVSHAPCFWYFTWKPGYPHICTV